MSHDSKEIRCPDCGEKTVIEPNVMDCDVCGYDIQAHQKQYAERRRSVQGQIRTVITQHNSFELVGTNLSADCVRVNLRAEGPISLDMDDVSSAGGIDESIFDRQSELAELKSELTAIEHTGGIEQWTCDTETNRGSRFGVIPDMSYADETEITLLVGTK